MPSSPDRASARKILDFWFSSAAEARWFNSDAAFDRVIRDRFGDLYEYAFQGELADWLGSAESALALVIMLDQFPRNMFRGSPRAFASDQQAREAARVAIDNAFDQQRPVKERQFFYLPLMHSEDLFDQTECVQLYRRLKDERSLKSALEHYDIVARFGRFPHRNDVLGRPTSDEEREFLDTHSNF